MRLSDGTPVTLRPIRPDDKERLRTAFRGLDNASVYTRFFHHKQDVTDAELRRLTELDPAKEVALVVTTGSVDSERIIAVGRYALSGERTAEVAFTVEEDFHRRGLAGRLLKELAQTARERGIARFEAYVLPQNASMLGVFERSGFAMSTEREDDALRVTLELG